MGIVSELDVRRLTSWLIGVRVLLVVTMLVYTCGVGVLTSAMRINDGVYFFLLELKDEVGLGGV